MRSIDLKRDVVDLCGDLISIDSINPFSCTVSESGEIAIDGNEDKMIEFCEYWLKTAGFDTWHQHCGNGRKNLLAQKGTGDRSLLLYGHLDTVEVKHGWLYEEALTPRTSQIQLENRSAQVLFGLGANDMKGGIAIILSAVTNIEPHNYCLKVALGCDEEFWSLGSYHLIHNSDFLDDVALIIVPETGESIAENKPEQALITLGRCGRTELMIDVPGSGGHGADPHSHKSVNAITQAAQIALAIENYSRNLPKLRPFKNSEQFVQASALVTRIEGGSGTLSIPDHARLIVNRVMLPGETLESAKTEIETLLSHLRETNLLKPINLDQLVYWPSVSIRSRPTPHLLPYLIDPEIPMIRSVINIAQRHANYQLGMGISVADENRFYTEAGKNVVVLGPYGQNAHAAYEWVSISSLYKIRDIYCDILKYAADIINL